MIDVDELKRQVDLEDFAQQKYGLVFDSRGRGRCYFKEQHNNGDAKPSLHLDRQKGRIRCHSQGCFGDKGVDVIDLVRQIEGIGFLEAAEQIASWAGVHQMVSETNEIKRLPQTVKEYNYRDRDRHLLYQVVRLDPKDFRVRRSDGRGGWVWGLGDLKPVLYRLREVSAGSSPVVVVEGEKCADALWDIGITATCNPFGAGKWRDEYSDDLAGRDVVLWPDKDGPGFKHMDQVAQSLSGKAHSIRTIQPLPELPEKGDVMDAIEDLGWDRGKIVEILDQAPLWVPVSLSDLPTAYGESETPEYSHLLVPLTASELMNAEAVVEWQVENMHAVSTAMLLSGDAGVGKSWLVLDLALAIDQGRPWLNHFAVRRGTVLIIDDENSQPLLKKRLGKLLRAHDLPEDGSTLGIQFLVNKGVNLSEDEFAEAMASLIASARPDLVVIDSLVRIHSGNENDAGDMAKLFRQIKPWMTKYGSSVVFCHHQRKVGATGNDPASMFRGSSDIRAFVDTHLDIQGIRGQPGKMTVRHVKSRYDQPVEPFGVEVVDPIQGVTEVRYTEAAKLQAGASLERACEFLRSLLSDGEWHMRPKLFEEFKEKGLKRDVLDDARNRLKSESETQEKKEGKTVQIRLIPTLRRSVTPIGVGTSERLDAVALEEELMETKVR